MNCNACSRNALGLFIRSVTRSEYPTVSWPTSIRSSQPLRSFSAVRRLHKNEAPAEPPKPFGTNKPQRDAFDEEFQERPAWQIHKERMREKLNGEAWNPRKKLSPDTMEGIRHLNQTKPEKFTTAVLAQHFKVSPEAIRRILKSKWRPSDAEAEDRLKRWDKRGEKIWSNLVELGIKPPKKWREMGVGRARDGQAPKWKSKIGRNTMRVEDSVTIDETAEDIIPTVDGSAHAQKSRFQERSLLERMGV